MNEELNEEMQSLGEYYTDTTGRLIEAGADLEGIWISSNRTNGREYFDDTFDAEDRIKQLYGEYLLEDDYSDGLDEF